MHSLDLQIPTKINHEPKHLNWCIFRLKLKRHNASALSALLLSLSQIAKSQVQHESKALCVRVWSICKRCWVKIMGWWRACADMLYVSMSVCCVARRINVQKIKIQDKKIQGSIGGVIGGTWCFLFTHIFRAIISIRSWCRQCCRIFVVLPCTGMHFGKILVKCIRWFPSRSEIAMLENIVAGPVECNVVLCYPFLQSMSTKFKSKCDLTVSASSRKLQPTQSRHEWQ